MDNLKDTEKFVIYKKDGDLPQYISKLVSWIERKIFNRISKRVNYLLARASDSGIEIIADGNEGKDEDDNWRIKESSGDLVIEKRISGVWVLSTKFKGT